MKLTKYVAMAIAACCAFTASAAEGDLAFGGYAGTVFKNGYLSNGTLIHDDPVFQSYVGVTLGNDKLGTFDFNFWNSIDPSESHYAGCNASEIDWEVAYSKSVGDFNVKLAVATWTYPNTDNWDDEWVGKVAVSYSGIKDILVPELNARFGLESQQGCYGQAKVSKGFDISAEKKVSANVYGLVGYASKSWRKGKGDDCNGFVDFEAGASVTWTFCENASLNVGCQYSIIIDSELRDNVDNGSFWQADGDDNHFMYYVGADVWF